ncbi:hypothetical protein [Streptoalloteichus hindustanus]|uniref:Uncharacterized protein n=1 Tax=Streptoalloteichus hindustanus TaxID=2017 RepID=A0A1M5D7F9_STRHI|nr:hypothetical protein [Streptoalloteichus hindustanus]SHF62989.1 hypothetical protein SAMN05444320_104332 [Streptoalloteichus hindustanus]
MNTIMELSDLDQLIEDLAARIVEVRLPEPSARAQSDLPLVCDLSLPFACV